MALSVTNPWDSPISIDIVVRNTRLDALTREPLEKEEPYTAELSPAGVTLVGRDGRRWGPMEWLDILSGVVLRVGEKVPAVMPEPLGQLIRVRDPRVNDAIPGGGRELAFPTDRIAQDGGRSSAPRAATNDDTAEDDLEGGGQ